MNTRILIRSMSTAAVMLWAAALPALADINSNRFVVFGDSLSDAGNYYYFYGQVSEAPFSPIPDAPYEIGGHHFSNGATWIERLARELDTPDSGRPALARPRVNTNYAVGRARARPNAPVFPDFDLSTQVRLFLSDARGAAPARATYVIWIGSNDVDDALNALQTDPTGATSAGILNDALTAVGGNIQALWAAGARSFFVPNMPDFGLTPALLALGPAAVQAGHQLSSAYNAGLIQVLQQLQALPGIRFTGLDVYQVLNAAAANPAEFGLSDVQTPCLSFFVVTDAICTDPKSHLFWDAIHPTTAGHEIVEEAAEHALRARPRDADLK
jgi:phospholipase/lecithinase/hemolysin